MEKWEGVQEIISMLCKYKGADIIAGAVYIDRVQQSMTIPIKLSVVNFVGYLKEKSTLMIYDRHSELQSRRDKALWEKGYYPEIIYYWESCTEIYQRASRRIKKEDSRSTAL